MYNPLKDATIRNSKVCYDASGIGFSVAWDTNDDYHGYLDNQQVTSTVVWDNTLFAVTTSGMAGIGPTSDQPGFTAAVYDSVEIKLRVTVPDGSVTIPTKGKIQFQTTSDQTYTDDKSAEFAILPDDAYHKYVVDMSQIKSWIGSVSRIRVFPIIDGTPGTKIYLRSIKAVSKTALGCSHFEGAGGKCSGSLVSSVITVVEGVNDWIGVNINNFGVQKVTITPGASIPTLTIAKEVESRLTSVAIGGYAGAVVEFIHGVFSITADDTREKGSTVVVSDSELARSLGFYNSSGVQTYTCTEGIDADSGYKPAATIWLSRSAIGNLLKDDPELSKTGLRVDPTDYYLEAGRSDFLDAVRDTTIDFLGDTIIDFNNPVTNTGIITSVSYVGDGFTSSAVKVFRPKSNGVLEYVTSSNLGLSETTTNKVIEASVSIKVRKGDYIGLYDGKVFSGRSNTDADVSYFIVTGDTIADIQSPLPTMGSGQRGINLYCRGDDKATTAVLDISFDNITPLESITVNAVEDEVAEEINLTHARAGGVNGGPFITTSTGLDKNGAPAPGITDVAALSDGIVVPTSSTTPVAHPLWEDSSFSPADLYDQTTMQFDFSFAKGVDVFFDINKIIIHFENEDNVKFFGIQYPITTDINNTDILWGFVPNYTSVFAQGKKINPADHPLYTNPMQPTSSTYLDSYKFTLYNTLRLDFPTIKARTIRYSVSNFNLESDVTKDSFSLFKLANSPRILEFEVYSVTTPKSSIDDNFKVETSSDGTSFYAHDSPYNVSSEGASYLVGYPVSKIRLSIEANTKIDVRSVQLLRSLGTTRIATPDNNSEVSLGLSSGDSSTIVVENMSSDTYNYYVDIAKQDNILRECILWNKLSDDTTLSTSEIGPTPYVYKRPGYSLRPYNYSYQVPSYIVDPTWLINKKSYVTYDEGGTYQELGNTLTNYNQNTFVTSENSNVSLYKFVYYLIDLGKVWSLDTIQVVAPGSLGYLTPFNITYTARDVSDPTMLDIVNDFTGSKESARWIRLSSFSVPIGSPAVSTYALSFIRASLQVMSPQNAGIIPWITISGLTDYKFGSKTVSLGEGSQQVITGHNNYYCVDLVNKFPISNVIAGPVFDVFSTVKDIDLEVPGGEGSLFDSTGTPGSRIAFGNSQTSDPNKVSWGQLGDMPSGADRWVLIKSDSEITDEVVVHVSNNIQADKFPTDLPRMWDSKIASVSRDDFDFKAGRSSIVFSYPDNTTALETVILEASLGYDHTLAPRDTLETWLYISNINNIDTQSIVISLGRNTSESNGGRDPLAQAVRDTSNYYTWSLTGYPLGTGWNKLNLPFNKANRIGEPYFSKDDFSDKDTSAVSGRSRFRWLSLAFSGTAQFTLKLSGLDIVRTKFDKCTFGNGLYLAETDYAIFPLDNFNVFEGTIEFCISPDWSKVPGCSNCQDIAEHTIFRMHNADGFLLAALMTGSGLRIYLSDGVRSYFLTDTTAASLVEGSPSHFALVWKLTATGQEPALQVFIDNTLSSTFEGAALFEAEFKDNSVVSLVLGARAWKGATGPNVASADAVIENIKVYNYALKEFSASISSPVPAINSNASNMIEISTTGDFKSTQDRGAGLPILVSAVAPGEKFEVKVRKKLGSTFPNKERLSYINIDKVKI